MYQLDKANNPPSQTTWQDEAQRLDDEQAQDLKAPSMTWWQPKELTEEEYFNALAETHGATYVVK